MTPKELWIEALRSGKYQQGSFALRKRDDFCCLGVACDLYQREFGDLKVFITEEGLYYYDRRKKILPKKVKDWLGLDLDNGQFMSKNGDHIDLIVLNDEGIPFNEIADLIEENIVEL